MKIMRITKSGKYAKEISQEELALQLAREGAHIIYCDLEGVAKLLNPRSGSDEYYLIDECGNSVYIDQRRFRIIE